MRDLLTRTILCLALVVLAGASSQAVAQLLNCGCPEGTPPEECPCELAGCTKSVDHTPPAGKMKLTTECGVPQVGIPEAKVHATLDPSSTRMYRVRIRAESVCPPDPGAPDICVCPKGFQDWYDPGEHLCNDLSCSGPPAGGTNFKSYPKQFTPPGSGGLVCTQEGDWVWCEKILQPGDTIGGNLGALNSCCDCDRVRKGIVCGEIDVVETAPVGADPNDPSVWTPAPSSYDVSGECRVASPFHPLVYAIDFDCFEPLDISCPAESGILWAKPPDTSCSADDFFRYAPSSQTAGNLLCRLDSSSFTSCALDYPQPVRMSDLSLADGEHTFYVKDPDAVNPTVDSYTWTYDSAGSCAGDTDFRLRYTLHFGTGIDNLISLPYENPYQKPENLCQAFDLPGTAEIRQIDPVTGVLNTHICGQVSVWSLRPRTGVFVRDQASSGSVSGFLVGSEQENVPVNLWRLGSSVIGWNLFPVEYHSTAQTPEDICSMCQLKQNQAEVTRYDAENGLIESHICGQVPIWNLRRGEALLVRDPTINPVNGLDCDQTAFHE